MNILPILQLITFIEKSMNAKSLDVESDFLKSIYQRKGKSIQLHFYRAVMSGGQIKDINIVVN